MVENIQKEEVKDQIREVCHVLNDITEETNDDNLLKGIMKFCERVKKYKQQCSRLSSAFHSFASQSNTSLKITATASLKRARKGKIYVQPEAVKRRKLPDGSKKSKCKGMSAKTNPFDKKQVQVKRPHNLSANISKNQAVPHKAGRTMGSKTKFLSQRKQTSK